MKRLLVIALALFTFTGFAQKMDSEKMNDAMKERLTRRGKMSPEKQAAIQSKRMALSLDLSDAQQSQVEALLIDHLKEGQENGYAQKKAKKDLTEAERHEIVTKKLDAQIALKQKMKDILNDEQYAKYSKMMDRRMQKGGKKKAQKTKNRY